ncbi:Ig-like domain-containing protein [Kitasatospora sp. NPDC059648]|uniref:Ig-like domain-containing protein n=1 Tax=Kitasatospora sp. NPDC059648 TaxID=3346894 RepID=UPI0036A81F7D
MGALLTGAGVMPATAAPVAAPHVGGTRAVVGHTFDFTGRQESYTVPAGALVRITADGAGGGDPHICSIFYGQPGGTGGRVVTTLVTKAATTYTVNVGGAGEQGCGNVAAGGYNGGGPGGPSVPGRDHSGGGGGGASSVSANGGMLVVAGGGGGAGDGSGLASGGRGGDGGLTAGDGDQGHTFSIYLTYPGNGGKGGSTPAQSPGTGGAGGDLTRLDRRCVAGAGGTGSSFSGATTGFGGAGGRGSPNLSFELCIGGKGGGGGGGGYFGGGGGGGSAEYIPAETTLPAYAAGGGAGGGSSFATPSGTATSYTTSPVGTANNNGRVTIDYSMLSSVTATAGTPQSTRIGTPFRVPFQARVTDTSGDPVPGAPVTFTAPKTGPSGTFGATQTSVTEITDANGVATASGFIANSQVGSYTLTASLPSELSVPPASFALTNSPPSTGPYLTITKNHTGNFTQGQQGIYTITVGNAIGAGQTTGTDVNVFDVPPPGLTAVSASGPGWTCTLTGGMTCTRRDRLQGGQNYPDITLTVDVSPTAPAQVTNTATTIGGGDTTIHTATDPTTINPAPTSPSLTISKHHTGNFVQGQQGTYTITAGNNGSGPTDGSTVIVEDLLPPGLTAAAVSGPGWGCDVGTVTCTRSDVLPAGQNYPDITLTVDVSPTAPAQVTNTAATAGGGSTTATTTDPTAIAPSPTSPSLTIGKTHSGNFNPGQGGLYTITVGNNGSGPTDGTPVIMTDTLPAGLTAAAITGPGWTCDLNTVTCTRSNVLAGGSSYPPITLKVNVSPAAPHEFTNTATVTGGGDTTTHTATDRVIRGTPPSLTISKTHTGNFTQGGKGTYTITVANTGGPTDGSAVTVQDMLPPGLTAVDISGPGWTCDLSAATCTRSDVLPAGTSYPTITLKVKVSCRAPHEVTNTATTTGGGDTTTHTATDPTTIKRDRDRDSERCHDDHRLTN